MRIPSSSSRSFGSAKKDIPPPLPPSKTAATASKSKPSSPVEAKRQYLESKKRTEEFLQDPQKKITQLHSEIDQVRETLEKQVYNKTVWQRLTDPLKRKQHSLINMIAATFAYILAYQLHLKRLANQKLRDESEERERRQRDLKRLLRSLLEEDYVRGMAEAAAEELADGGTTTGWPGWPWSAPPPAERPSTLSRSRMDALTRVLRQKLEERIGDEGMDDDTKKERGIERIWKQNQQKLQSDGDDDMASLLALAEEAVEDEGRSNTLSNRKRVIDI
jgi:hypothetical protein